MKIRQRRGPEDDPAAADVFGAVDAGLLLTRSAIAFPPTAQDAARSAAAFLHFGSG